MNVRELIENAYRCGQNDGYDFRDEQLKTMNEKIIHIKPESELPTLTENARLRRLELALADLILYTHTLCQSLRADVGTVENARMFQRAKNNTQAFAVTIGAELARDGITLCPPTPKPEDNGEKL